MRVLLVLFSLLLIIETNPVVAQPVSEVVTPSKGELLEETLYGRYFTEIGKTFPDFIMCPRINSIERIKGDKRRHLVHVSSLNYAGHHAPSFDKIDITLIDTPESGIKIINVISRKNISEIESLHQCRKS